MNVLLEISVFLQSAVLPTPPLRTTLCESWILFPDPTPILLSLLSIKANLMVIGITKEGILLTFLLTVERFKERFG